MMTVKKFSIAAFQTICICLALVGCVTMGQSGPADQNALRNRVVKLWDARVAKNWDAVYSLLNAQYKTKVPAAAFVSKSHFNVLSYNIKDISLKESQQPSALVLTVFNTTQMGYQLEISVKEEWLYENGDWYLKQSDQATPFDTPSS